MKMDLSNTSREQVADKLLKVVCSVFKINSRDLLSGTRYRPYPDARKVFALFLTRYDKKIQDTYIANKLCLKNRTAVVYQIKEANFQLETNKEFKNRYMQVASLMFADMPYEYKSLNNAQRSNLVSLLEQKILMLKITGHEDFQ
jgi:chromosomal replication initiation ATPase DnaA